jgi:hypothetical protein
MRWKGSRGSSNVKDRRGSGGVAVGGGLGGILIVVLYLVLGGDPGDLARDGTSPATAPLSAGEDPAFDFASVILASTEEVWSAAFSIAGLRYVPPSMVVYSGRTSSMPGSGRTERSATGVGWNRETWTRGWQRPPRSGTTDCSAVRGARSCRRHSHTDPPPSANVRSGWASRAVTPMCATSSVDEFQPNGNVGVDRWDPDRAPGA